MGKIGAKLAVMLLVIGALAGCTTTGKAQTDCAQSPDLCNPPPVGKGGTRAG